MNARVEKTLACSFVYFLFELTRSPFINFLIKLEFLLLKQIIDFTNKFQTIDFINIPTSPGVVLSSSKALTSQMQFNFY